MSSFMARWRKNLGSRAAGVNGMALLKVNPGDVVAVPAEKKGEWGFVLARVIRSGVVTWIEVFEDFYTDFNIDEKAIAARNFSEEARLFKPVYAAFDFGKYFGKVKWPVLATDASYTPDQSNISSIEFEGDSYQESGIYYKNGVECVEPAGVRRGLENRTIYSNPQLVRRINLYLSGYFEKGVPWNSEVIRAVVEKEGMDWWVDGINACNDKADAVALKFKEVRKRVKK